MKMTQMTKLKIVPDKFAIMACDPGNTTGCGTGIFRTDKGDNMLVTVMARAIKKNTLSTWHETGQYYEQAWVLAHHWLDFRYKCNVEYGIPLPDIHLVIEAFNLRKKNVDLTPVSIIGGLVTLLYSNKLAESNQPWPLGEPEWQEPSTAKSVTNHRLKLLNVWVPGSEHRRDVMRHIVSKVSAIL
jgi:hypothetical protein